jgi:hypothetical protein
MGDPAATLHVKNPYSCDGHHPVTVMDRFGNVLRGFSGFQCYAKGNLAQTACCH